MQHQNHNYKLLILFVFLFRTSLCKLDKNQKKPIFQTEVIVCLKFVESKLTGAEGSFLGKINSSAKIATLIPSKLLVNLNYHTENSLTSSLLIAVCSVWPRRF